MAFDVAGSSYQRFMGRFSEVLGAPFADFAGVAEGPDQAPAMRVLDVGCGPGALTSELVRRLGADHVAGIDPSATFVAAARERLPDVDIRQGEAESLPFGDGSFDAALAQLVVHFMTDPDIGVAEMARVVRPGGVVAVCVWDFGGGRGPVSIFWSAAADLDPGLDDESGRTGARHGDLEALLGAVGLQEVRGTELTVTRRYPGFDGWWEPYTLGVGPAGDYVRGLSAADTDRLRDRCRELLPDGPFGLDATAWAARGIR